MQVPLAILGLTGTIGPLMLMRELVAVSGNDAQEVLAVLAASWIWIAIGAWLAEYRGRGVPFDRETASIWSRPYAGTLILVALFLPLQIVLVRATPRAWLWGWGGIGLAILLSAPPSLLLGAQYALGRRLMEIQETVPGRAFIYQALGAACGGLLFASPITLLLNAIQIVLAIAALNLVAGWWMASILGLSLAEGIASPLYAYFLVFVALGLGILALPIGAAVDEITLARQWPGLVVARDSPQGRAIIAAEDGEGQLYWSGVALFGISDEQNKALVRRAWAAHPSPRHVMLIGGDPAGLEVALAESPETLHYAEPDPALAELWQETSSIGAMNVVADQRVTLANTDARSYLKDSGYQYDLIFVNLPGPVSELLNRYYTVEFWSQVQEALAPGGKAAARLSIPDQEDSNSIRCAAGVRAAFTQEFSSVEEVRGEAGEGQLILVGLANHPSPVDSRLAQKANLDLLPTCPATGMLLRPLSVANLGNWTTKYGWLASPVGLLFLLGLGRRNLRLPLLPAFVSLAGGAILAQAIISTQRALGLTCIGAAELLMAYAAGLAVGGGVAWPLTGRLKRHAPVLLTGAALLAQSIFTILEPSLIHRLVGKPFFPWAVVGLMALAGLNVGVVLATIGSQGEPGVAYVTASAGEAMGTVLAGLLIIPSASITVAGQAIAALTMLGVVWLLRIE